MSRIEAKIKSGADCISTKLLKELAPMIITPLHHLINLSLETGTTFKIQRRF